MPTIMIVDDEETIRQGLALAIRRLAPDWDIVSQVEDGLEAVHMLEKGQPDLMIVDISMPGMNGLELTSYVREHYPNVFQIVLSGHDNFSYVQSTMRSGVVDYLLKPLDRQELMSALSNVQKRLAHRKDSERERSSGKRMQVEKAFLDWLSGEDISIGYIEARLRDIGWTITGQQYAVVVLLETTEIEYPDAGNMDVLLNGFWAHFSHINQFLGFEAAANHYVLCVEGCDMPIDAMRDYWRDLFRVGISGLFDDLEMLPEAYRETMQVVYAKEDGLSGSSGVWQEEDLNEREERLLVAISEDNAVLTKELLHQWQEDLLKTPSYQTGLAQLRFYRFYSLLGRSSGKDDSALGRHIRQEVPWLLARMAPPFSARNFARAMSDFLRRIDGLVLDGHKPDHRKVVREAKAYIQLHYADPELNLEQLAQHVYLNANYLSELFKQVTGNNFIEYVTSTRMAEAKRLLRETHLKTYEVAENVGYTSAKYFSTLFRKLHGLTPSEYRDRI